MKFPASRYDKFNLNLDPTFLGSALKIPSSRGLSWSQVNAFRNMYSQWEQRYIFKNRTFETVHLEKGKRFGEIMEGQIPLTECSEDELDIYYKMDKQKLFEVGISMSLRGVPLTGYLDNASRDLRIVNEYKTGTVDWDQEKAEFHGQLRFYALLVYLLMGYIPDVFRLQYAPTHMVGNHLMFTGEVKTFEVSISYYDVEEFAEFLLDTAMAINRAVNGYYNPMSLEIDHRLFNSYSQLFADQKARSEDIDQVKDLVYQQMLDNGLQKIRTEHGLFSISSRSSWSYSQDIKFMEDALKVAKKEEQANQTATETLKYSLRYTPSSISTKKAMSRLPLSFPK